MPMIWTYAEPVEDTVTVKIPKDIHFFDPLHTDWGGEGSAEEIASSIRASRQVNRLIPDW